MSVVVTVDMIQMMMMMMMMMIIIIIIADIGVVECRQFIESDNLLI